MNKKAIELSINFIVIMILSIAILASSFILVQKFFGKATQLKASLDADTETKIRNLLVAGERVAIPMNTKEVKKGSPVTFAVGISNVLKDNLGSKNTFTVSVDGGTCKVVGGGAADLTTQVNPTIDINKYGSNIVLVLVDTSQGVTGKTYKCDIKVTTDIDDGINNNQVDYADPVYKAYVKIK